MAELNKCPKCGGDPGRWEDFFETDFGDRRFICIRCKKCYARTMLYLCEVDDPMTTKSIEYLWNRGRVGGGLDG